jgi:hypothetical protein
MPIRGCVHRMNFMPVSIYHFDGMDVAKKFPLNDWYLTFKAFGGYMHNEISSYLSGLTRQNSVVGGENVRYENNDWLWFLGYAYVQIVSKLPTQSLKRCITNSALSISWANLPQLLPELPIKSSQFHYNDLGFIYDDGVWLSQSELAYVSSNTSWIQSKIHAYFSLGRRFSNLTLYSLFGIVRSFDHNTVKVPALSVPSPVLLSYQQLSNQILNDHGFNEQSISIGTRWDVHENIALKTRWTHYWLGNIGMQQWQSPQTTIFNMMSVGMDFIF